MNSSVEAVDLQAARSGQAAFFVALHDALRMGEKSAAVHNWFRNSSEICGFTGIQCDADGLVITADLSSMGLVGTLPSSWAPLTRLERLSLRNNDIFGALPSYLPVAVMYFNVDRNRLQGNIPNFEFTTTASTSSSSPFGSQLERLILSDNLLEGTLPDTICQLELLRALNLSRNPHLEGRLPKCLPSLNDLRGLQVRGTRLIGPVLPDGLCQPSENSLSGVSTQEGYCERFGFCLNGYREDTVHQGDSVKVLCCACNVPSNVLASSNCQWIYEPPTRSPSKSPAISMAPSAWPFPEGSSSPNHELSFMPSSSKPNQFSSARPSRVPTLESLSYPVSFNKHLESERPSFLTSNEHGSNAVHGVQSQGGKGTSPSSSHAFYDNTVFIPVFILLCLIILAAVLLAAPSLWRRFERKRRFGASPDLADPDNYSFEDENDDDTQEEIIFSKESYCALRGFNDQLENGAESMPVCDFGCLLSPASALDAPAIPETTAEPLASAIPVTARSCIVQPQTLSANPKVRFLLWARSMSSTSGDGLGLDGIASSEDTGDRPNDFAKKPGDLQALALKKSNDLDCCPKTSVPKANTGSLSSLGSIFCAPVCVAAKQTSPPPSKDNTGLDAHVKCDEDAAWTSPQPLSSVNWPDVGVDVVRPSIASDSSSLSSTTPSLNPFTGGCSNLTGLKALSRRLAVVPHRRRADDEAALAEYARKYFPEEAMARSQQPPIQEVECFPEHDVSFSWSASIDGQAPLDFRTSALGAEQGRRPEEMFSFRPPRYYKAPTAKHQPLAPTARLFPEPRFKVEEEHYVLGIRPPYVDNACSDDEYEIELYGIPTEDTENSRSMEVARDIVDV